MKKLSLAIISLLMVAFMLAGCQVIRGERTYKQYDNDAAITSKVKYRLVRSDELSASRVHVETDNGVVLLSGFVKSSHQRIVAVKIARSVRGVKHVSDNLVVHK